MKSLNFNKEKLKVVIFDFDDTIYNISSWKNWGPYVKEMLTEILGSQDNAEKFVEKHNISYSTNGQQIAVALIHELGSAKKMCEYLSKNIFDIWAGTTITHLTNEDFQPIIGKYKLYVLSNSPTTYVLKHLEKMGIDENIFDKICQNDFESNNPTKQVIYKNILKKENLKPDEAVMIGDSYLNDIVPAVELGMQGVWINGLDEVRKIIEKLAQTCENQLKLC